MGAKRVLTCVMVAASGAQRPQGTAGGICNGFVSPWHSECTQAPCQVAVGWMRAPWEVAAGWFGRGQVGAESSNGFGGWGRTWTEGGEHKAMAEGGAAQGNGAALTANSLFANALVSRSTLHKVIKRLESKAVGQKKGGDGSLYA